MCLLPPVQTCMTFSRMRLALGWAAHTCLVSRRCVLYARGNPTYSSQALRACVCVCVCMRGCACVCVTACPYICVFLRFVVIVNHDCILCACVPWARAQQKNRAERGGKSGLGRLGQAWRGVGGAIRSPFAVPSLSWTRVRKTTKNR